MFQLFPRRREAELMDAPALDVTAQDAGLRGLARINRLSRSEAIYWRALQPFLTPTKRQPLRLLDLASGGGDVMIALARRAAALGAGLRIVGSDRSATAVALARRNAERAGVELDFRTLDVIGEDLPEGFDIISHSLFLHHLSDDEALLVLRKMRTAAQRGVIVNDLRRSRRGLLMARVIPRLITRSPIVWVDAVRSVRAAFTPAEARILAERAGMHGAQVRRSWPQRYVLTWMRTD